MKVIRVTEMFEVWLILIGAKWSLLQWIDGRAQEKQVQQRPLELTAGHNDHSLDAAVMLSG